MHALKDVLNSSLAAFLLVGMLQLLGTCTPCFGQVESLGESKTADEVELEEFKTWAKEFAKKPHTEILLPDAKAWFTEHFEADLANRLAEEYSELSRSVVGLPYFFQNAKNSGKTEVHVSSTSKAIDLKANGLQNAALQRTKKRLTLFTLRMIAPGEEAGSSLWSFIKQDGEYRFLGKMSALNPTQGDLVADLLCQMPLEKTEKILQEKGLLQEPAVDYLKRKGILK